MTVKASAYATDALPWTTVDAVVIGGGAAGLNGALMRARSRRSVVVIDSDTPRNAPAEAMHGFIVLDGTPPAELLEQGREQVHHYGGGSSSARWPPPSLPPPVATGAIRVSRSLWPTASP
jgi:glycine/D-amino acid oxidase-like deaminating enzyme